MAATPAELTAAVNASIALTNALIAFTDAKSLADRAGNVMSVAQSLVNVLQAEGTTPEQWSALLTLLNDFKLLYVSRSGTAATKANDRDAAQTAFDQAMVAMVT